MNIPEPATRLYLIYFKWIIRNVLIVGVNTFVRLDLTHGPRGDRQDDDFVKSLRHNLGEHQTDDRPERQHPSERNRKEDQGIGRLTPDGGDDGSPAEALAIGRDLHL